jgi:AcrR family transcriptional regulator
MGTRTIHDTRRAEIITAARELFSRKGYHGTPMPEIAQAAGISTGLIYYFFPSKEDILVACCEAGAAIHRDLFKQTSSITDPLERFDFIVRNLYTVLDKNSKLLIILYRDTSTLNRERRQRILPSITRLDALFLELILEGQRKGVFSQHIPYPQVLAANIVSLGHQWALQKTWRFAPAADLETYISTQLDYFHTLLLDKTAHAEDSDSIVPLSETSPPPAN